MPHEQKDTKNLEIDNDKLWATVAYFFFPLPMILVKKRSSFLNYHINQAIILLIISLAGQFGFGILPGWMGLIPGKIFSVLMLTCLVMGVMNVLKKEMKPLPIIGGLFNFIK